ncbi:hypothetical protein [Thiolapillus sp.]|uniref:hypothetical protein n=1 Tax=Thiolapillus sp. TaxID=2017437 RepID=UPI003AF71A80
MYIEPKKRAAIAKLKIMYGTNEKKKHWKKKLREAWKNGIYPKKLNNEEITALQEMKETIGKSGLAKL